MKWFYPPIKDWNSLKSRKANEYRKVAFNAGPTFYVCVFRSAYCKNQLCGITRQSYRKKSFSKFVADKYDCNFARSDTFKIGLNEKNSSVQKKKVLKKTVVAKVVSQLPEIKPAVETDISSREKQLAKILKLKDILETSEGRYAFIDEKKVSYIVQEGEWLDSVFVRKIYKNSVELQEIDGETTLILVLQP